MLRCVDFKSTFKRAYRIYRSKSILVVFYCWNPTKKCKFLWAPLVPLLGWASKDPINSRSPLHKAKVFFIYFFFQKCVYACICTQTYIYTRIYIHYFPLLCPSVKKRAKAVFYRLWIAIHVIESEAEIGVDLFRKHFLAIEMYGPRYISCFLSKFSFDNLLFHLFDIYILQFLRGVRFILLLLPLSYVFFSRHSLNGFLSVYFICTRNLQRRKRILPFSAFENSQDSFCFCFFYFIFCLFSKAN